MVLTSNNSEEIDDRNNAIAVTALQQDIQNVPSQHPFYGLPQELIWDIVDYLPPEAFINFVFANYPLLRHHGLAPALSKPRIDYLTNRTRISSFFPLLRLPTEIMLQVIRYLKPLDVMKFVVANYRDLTRQGIAPPLTAETERTLWKAIRV